MIYMFESSQNEAILNRIKGGLIVSCQALADEPLYSSMIMGRMALAAKEGGACGIRANTPEDIAEIKKTVDLPIIGLTKCSKPKCSVYITPTMEEVDNLCAVGCEIIAMDATLRLRPDGSTINTLFPKILEKYSGQMFMADVATYEEGINAQRLGFDLVSTALSGYTGDTKNRQLPDFELMGRLAADLKIPVLAEGGIWSPDDLKKAMDQGVFACVVGTAITRPRDITRRFISALK